MTGRWTCKQNGGIKIKAQQGENDAHRMAVGMKMENMQHQQDIWEKARQWWKWKLTCLKPMAVRKLPIIHVKQGYYRESPKPGTAYCIQANIWLGKDLTVCSAGGADPLEKTVKAWRNIKIDPRIQSLPGKRILWRTISASMQPTDHMSTSAVEQSR